jgi:hypothetical protein
VLARQGIFLAGFIAAAMIIGLLIGWIGVAAASLPSVTIHLWPAAYRFEAPGWVLPLCGVVLGLLPMLFFASVTGGDMVDELPGISPIAVFAFLVAGVGAASKEISFLSACVVVPLALGALVTVFQLLSALAYGGAIEVESRWGGLGGGLGGWRLSREASLLLLALALIAGTVAVVQPAVSPGHVAGTDTKDHGGTEAGKTTAQSGAGASAKPASGEPGPAAKN